MTLDEIIEIGARTLADVRDGASLRYRVCAVLEATCPGLLDGTHAVLPLKAPPAMYEADDARMPATPRDAWECYEAMVAAYLNKAPNNADA